MRMISMLASCLSMASPGVLMLWEVHAHDLYACIMPVHGISRCAGQGHHTQHCITRCIETNAALFHSLHRNKSCIVSHAAHQVYPDMQAKATTRCIVSDAAHHVCPGMQARATAAPHVTIPHHTLK